MTETRDRPAWKPWDRKRDSSRRTRRCSRWTCTTSGASRPSGRRGGSKAMARIGASLAPFADPLAALARAHAQIVESVLPAGLLGEGGVVGIEPEGGDLADGFRLRACRGRRPARASAAPTHALQIVRARRRRARANASSASAQFVLLLATTRSYRAALLVVHLGARAREPLGVVFLLDRLGERGRSLRDQCRPAARRSVMRSSITWPAEPSCSRITSVLRTRASSTMSASRCS